MPQPEYVQRGYLREDFRLFHLKGPMEEQLDWHYHTFHKLIFFLGGTSSYGLEGRSYPLEAGDMILVPQGCVHRPEAVPSLAADEKIAAIMQYLSQNPTEQISIDDLAARFYISKYHMMRRFRAETGYTIHAYLTGKRLVLAREQIAAGMPVLQAAGACGVGDYSAFCRAYRRQFGQPPSSAR